MDSRHRSVLLTLIVIAACLTAVAVTDSSDAEQSVDIGGIKAHTFTDSVSISTGNSSTVTVALSNNNTETYHIVVSASVDPSDRMGVDVSEYSKSLDAGKSQTFDVTVSANSTAVSGNYTVTVKVTVTDMADTSTSGTLTVPVKVSSDYSSEGYYNKIMGVFESPIDNAAINALITLGIWVGIAFVLSVITHRILLRMAEKDENDDLRKDAKTAGLFVMILVMLFGIPSAVRVSGVDERLIATISDVVTVLIAANVAYIIWKLYKVIAYDLIIRRDDDNRIDDSLYPLVKMLGQIVITVLTLSYVLSVYGLDLGAIVTSAGIATLAISLGAQSTLNQFFCGLVLLVTRPFRIGDKVRLGTSTEVLIVRKIGVMETEFKVWLNEEVQHIPNSMVMASSIINITKGDKCYKVVDYIDIDYSADIDKAREIIMSILASHPRIVNDGSKPKPDFRFSSMEDSAIRIRISYIVYDHEYWHAVSCQVKEAIYKKFKVSGIKVPHNIVDVHME